MPQSSGERLWWVAGGLGAFIMVLIGWFFFISPERSNTSDIDNQASAARQQNAVLQARIDALKAENTHAAKYQSQLARAQLALPSESGISDFLRTMQKIGDTTATNVSALSVGPPQPAAAAPTSAASTPSENATATTTAPRPVGGPGVYGLPITATVTGQPAALGRFLEQLQSVQPRAVLITQLVEGTTDGATAPTAGNAGANSSSGATSLQLTMKAFVETVAPTPTAAAPTAAPSPAAS